MTEFTEDPSRECDNMVMPGVQHKYPETLVVLVTNECFQHCEHCFRKRNVGRKDEVCADYEYEVVEQYIEEHDEITNVLLTGGDPLITSPAVIETICQKVYATNNVSFIRIGTRALTYEPGILRSYVGVFRTYNVALILHINRIEELGSEQMEAVNMLQDQGVILRSQTVLLRGVNDEEEKLIKLFQGLAKWGIFPYYLFQCRPVIGNEKFMVPLLEAMLLVNEVRHKLSGLEKTFRFVLSTTEGKLEALGTIGGRNLMYRFHQAKHPGLRNRLFVEPLTDESVWCRGENVKPFKETLVGFNVSKSL